MRRHLLALAAAIVPVGSPVFAQPQSDYEAGVEARQAGRPAEAKRLLEAWLNAHPDDVDARLQLAYTELALGNLNEAEAGFEAVLRQSPNYRDARDGLAQVAERRRAPEFGSRGHAVLEGALSDLSGSAAAWREVALDVEAPIGGSATMGARAAYYDRFGLEDVELTGRIGLHPSENIWVRAHLGGTPDADFRPELDIGGGLDLRVTQAPATVVTFDAAYQRFPLQDVVSFNPGIVRYLDSGRGWITLRGIGTIADGGPLQVGGLLRGDLIPAEGWQLFAGISNGPDTDLGVVTRVTGLFAGVEVPLGERFGVIGSIGHDWRETGFDRTDFRLALKARF